MFDIFAHPWRVGRKLGRTIYCMTHDLDSDDDFLLGMVDTVEVAQYICMVHNQHLAAHQT